MAVFERVRGLLLLLCCITLLVVASGPPGCHLPGCKLLHQTDADATDAGESVCDVLPATDNTETADDSVNTCGSERENNHRKSTKDNDSAHPNTGSVEKEDLSVNDSASGEDSVLFWIGDVMVSYYTTIKEFIGKLCFADDNDYISNTNSEPGVDNNPSEFGKIKMDEFLERTKKMAESLLQDLGRNAEAGLLNDLFSADDAEDMTVIPEGEDVYEYPPLARVEPGVVGEERSIDIMEGVKNKMITRSMNPPIYEIPNFLSNEECDHIIEMAEKRGMKVSKIFKDRTTTLANQSVESRVRNSESSFLDEKKGDISVEFMEKIYERVSRLTQLPVQVIRQGELLAIGRYTPGGFYNAHLDSTMIQKDKPCCFQTECKDDEGNVTLSNWDCCRFCRYATVLYYLSDVEEGGETAFPLADTKLSEMMEKGGTENWGNLTSHCHQAPVVIRPEKGKALFWYNHGVDRKGYLGALNKRSYHGGCGVTQGTKWIATNWITTPSYTDRFKKSKFAEDYDSFNVY